MAPRQFTSRPPTPPRPPVPHTSITEIARRYHAVAFALATTLRVPLEDVLTQHRESCTAVFIEACRQGVPCPAALTLPALHQTASPPPHERPPTQPPPAEPPDANGHPPPGQPTRGREQERRASFLAAIALELLHEVDGAKHWRPGAKAHCERAFGVMKWAQLQRLSLDRLQTGYITLQSLLTPARLAETEPLEEEISPPQKAVKEPTPAVAHALTPEQQQLVDEGVSWGIPNGECESIVRRYPLDQSRSMLWRAKEARRKIAKGALV